MNFGEIAAVAGKGGLFKVLKPSKAGVILESLDDKKTKLVVGADARVSILSEISIYTHTQEGSTPLIEVMRKIHEEFEGDTGLDKNSDGEELKSFLKHILPDYDEDRVYVSDIKKLVTWYNLLAKIAPESFMEQPADEAPEEKEAE
ncbi:MULTISPECIES: DUF5606 domain-containing protein [Roseivirga]|jgi:hypothetical protein|uniref:DUF5606 domain-containing protein n=1 Tax=Roseivirga thermotolerans TaxID=1758176 RepID=A0ABQ3I608_9BACT|nr:MULTISPECIES: DUF5606 domain-containing protein [Roseivirga]MEC7752571.1 DUF5606 domain-containing protein [Bacteroidota bacterium]GHE67049.1 hypothetical protein GCM10011340_23130 [Roseivirga thermotolerans]|tara:strand:+ start:9060 stop:9497 length:438 start_codon:yes stop_codon:yes gene_type:complete